MERLIAEIEQDALMTAHLTGVKNIDHHILEAIRSIDRSEFVRPEDRAQAFDDHPLSIGFGQTISQPFIVALMIHLIKPMPTDKILEIGSGSGYLVAVLSRLCTRVYGVEIIPELVERSTKLLNKVNITNADITLGDGHLGLKDLAPFDKIIISAAAKNLPQELLRQLKVCGIMVMPKTLSPFEQMLIRIEKVSDAEFSVDDILPVRFVPLVNL